MARLIKFRAWDDQCNKMIESFNDEYKLIIDEEDNKLRCCKINEYGEWLNELRLMQFTELRLMQFTGLRDANGNEIYEGDIISSLTTTDLHYVVKCNNGGFFLYSRLGKWGPISNLHSIFEKFDIKVRVIGNIYENADLISAKQSEESEATDE